MALQAVIWYGHVIVYLRSKWSVTFVARLVPFGARMFLGEMGKKHQKKKKKERKSKNTINGNPGEKERGVGSLHHFNQLF